MKGRFEGKIALVTGGSSGIGRASAKAFATEGAKVVICGRNQEGGETTVDMIKKGGGQSIFVKADVTKAAEVEALINKVIETYGRLDCALNNAGVEGNRSSTVDCTEETWDHVININLKGVWLCMKYEIPQMLKQNGGTIVNMSSTFGLVGVWGLPAYVASKHGIVGLTKTAALEYAQSGIRVNAVCPGTIRTPMQERLMGGNPQVEVEILKRYPLRRSGTPEEVAEGVVWLCSNSASFITGQTLVIDGGFIAQ